MEFTEKFSVKNSEIHAQLCMIIDCSYGITLQIATPYLSLLPGTL